MSWQHFNPVKIHLGRDCRQQLVAELTGLNLLIVTSQRGKKQFSEDQFLQKILGNNQVTWLADTKENPDLADIQHQINSLHSQHLQAIIAFGGGSTMDAAKSIRLGLATQGQHSLEKLIEQPELHKKAQQIPLYALPTTAGTGSEVTPFATVWNHAKKQKLSLSSEVIFPTAAYVDAALTDSLPSQVTLSTGLDAINQAAESIWNKNATPLTLAYATRALKLGLPALPKLVTGTGNQTDREIFRENLAEASLLAGLAISQTRTALCHSISYPLTAHFGVPHGLACAFTMSSVLRYNLSADDGRFTKLAYNLLGTNNTSELLELFENLHIELEISTKIKQQISCFNEILSVKHQMISNERANNNLRNVDIKSITLILSEAWNKNPLSVLTHSK